MADQTLQTLHPSLTRNDTKLQSGGTLVSYSSNLNSGSVLCMVHGWPENSYMWRHIVPMLQKKISLFIPELPGYGISSLPPDPSKRTTGHLIMEALQAVFGKDRPVIWCGHDRGARVGHRLLVDNEPRFNILHAILMDIVPTLIQWRSFANPKAAVAYYHWPFLATPIAPQMIEAIGGAQFCELNLNRVKGGNSEGIAKFQENHAWDNYAHQFTNPECIAGSCADYAYGATQECEDQIADQEAGRKIKIPTMVLYSSANLGAMHDVPGVWGEWFAEGAEVRLEGAPDRYGHFLPEECPEWTAKKVGEWIDHLGN